MEPKALILDGKIDDARAILIDRVKRSPADQQSRSLLFQVMLLRGEWDKAQRQLEIAATRQAPHDMNATVYQHLIQAEKERAAVAAMEQRPTFFPEIPAYAEDFFNALELLKNKNGDAAAELFSRVEAALPVVQGTINGEAFNGFRDTDATLAFFIEAIEYERYLWVPISNIRELVVSPPATLIDLIWAKGRITTWEGLTMGCFLPALYPNSFASTDDRIRLGRLTEWHAIEGNFARAVGQHVYDVGGTDRSIFELADVNFSLADPAADEKGDTN